MGTDLRFSNCTFRDEGILERGPIAPYDDIKEFRWGDRAEYVNGVPINEVLQLRIFFENRQEIYVQETLDIRPVWPMLHITCWFNSKKREARKKEIRDQRARLKLTFLTILRLLQEKTNMEGKRIKGY